MQSKFIVSHEGQELGPLSEPEIKQMLATGELLPIDYVYDEDREDWILINERFEVVASPKPDPLNVKPPAAKVNPTEGADAPPPAQVVARRGRTPANPVPPASNVLGPPMAVKNTPAVAPTATPPAAQITSDIGRVSFSGGVGTVSLKQLRAGRVVLRLKDCSSPNLSLPSETVVNVQPGPAKLLSWELPSECRAGEEIQLSVAARDAYDNPTSAFDGHLELNVKGAMTERHKVVFAKGTASLKLRWTKSGLLQVEMADPNHHNLGLPAPRTVTVKAGPAAKLVVESPSQSVAGDNLPVTVKAVDEFGNLATDFKGEIAVGMTVETDKIPKAG